LPLLYLDSSALVKLVLHEPESEALRQFIHGADLLSSELVLVEVPRAVRRAAANDPALPVEPLIAQAERVLESVALAPLDHGLLLGAGALSEPMLRALDAIHVATAADLGPIHAFVTFDERQAAAARLAGLRTVSPGT